MSRGTWQILSLGFVGLILLILIHGLEGTARTREIYRRVSGILDTYRRSESLLNEIRTDVLLSSILVRDRVLETQAANRPPYRDELLQLRASSMQHLKQLWNNGSAIDADSLGRLQSGVEAYWQALDPLLNMPEQEPSITRPPRQLLAHRQMIASTVRQIHALNLATLEQEKSQIEKSQAEFESQQRTVVLSLLVMGVLVCVGCILLLCRLDRKARQETQKTSSARQQLRALSQRLLKTQENERKQISRELHDQVGQILTALKLQVGQLERFKRLNPPEFAGCLNQIQGLATDSLEAVRHLAKGLRPSVLDDLGLEAAVRWQVEEFSRRTGIPAELEFCKDLEDLPDALRTCIFRIVQESLTNCARHSQAAHVKVVVERVDSHVRTQIVDDGIGMDQQASDIQGLGLLGMQERADELGGQLNVKSRKGQGTTVQVALPLGSGVGEPAHA